MPEQVSRTNVVHALLHCRPSNLVNVVPGERPLVWGGGPVVSLGDFGPVALLEDELLLGQEIVRVGGVELPDLVEDGEFFLGIEA